MKAPESKPERPQMSSPAASRSNSNDGLLRKTTPSSSPSLFRRGPAMFRCSARAFIPALIGCGLFLLLVANVWLWYANNSTVEPMSFDQFSERSSSKAINALASLDDTQAHVEDTEEALKNLRSMVGDITRILETSQHRNRLDNQQVMPLGVESYDCVHNPARHYERTGAWRPECSPMAPPSFHRHPENAWPSVAFMLSLETPESLESYVKRKLTLLSHDIQLLLFPAVNGKEKFAHLYTDVWIEAINKSLRVYDNPRTGHKTIEGGQNFLTPGEEGYRASMRKLFSLLLRDENVTSALVLDDDVMFSCTFHNDLRKLLKEPRCGAHVSSDSERGGVLLLGSSIWLNGTYPQRGPYLSGWNIVDEDMRRTSEQVARVVANGPTCFNVPSKVMGSFAVLFHRDVFQPIIDWIDSSSRPFDHVFEALADSGYIVRAAYPSIAVQDLTHESSVDPGRVGQQNVEMRARTHRWPLEKICSPNDNKPVLVKKSGKKVRSIQKKVAAKK